MAKKGFGDNDTSNMALGRLAWTGEIPMTRITKLGLIYARSIRGSWTNMIQKRFNYKVQRKGKLFMKREEKYPLLFGYSDMGKTELHGIKEVAKYIKKFGKTDDLYITTPEGKYLLNTFGTRIMNVDDSEYRKQLFDVLYPQKKRRKSYEETLILNRGNQNERVGKINP